MRYVGEPIRDDIVIPDGRKDRYEKLQKTPMGEFTPEDKQFYDNFKVTGETKRTVETVAKRKKNGEAYRRFPCVMEGDEVKFTSKSTPMLPSGTKYVFYPVGKQKNGDPDFQCRVTDDDAMLLQNRRAQTGDALYEIIEEDDKAASDPGLVKENRELKDQLEVMNKRMAALESKKAK